MKIFKKYEVSINFWTKFLIKSLASGALLPEPLQMHSSKFMPKFSRKIREILGKILKKLQNFN